MNFVEKKRQKKLDRIILNRFTKFVYLLPGPENKKKK